jgi:hypothetical protein
MHRDIVVKLEEELKKPIESERQVVYILVELRKLLELNGTLENYETLKLCCDWAVHPKLNRNRAAQKIVKLLDEYEDKYRREQVGVQQAEMPELSDFLGHNKFRKEMVEACDANEIPTSAVLSDDWWCSFLVHYTEVVKDCPLEASGIDAKYVERVTAQAVTPSLAAAIMPSKQFGIQWVWFLKGEDRPNTVMSFF